MEHLTFEYEEQGTMGHIDRSGGTAERRMTRSFGDASEANSLKNPGAKGSVKSAK